MLDTAITPVNMAIQKLLDANLKSFFHPVFLLLIVAAHLSMLLAFVCIFGLFPRCISEGRYWFAAVWILIGGCLVVITFVLAHIYASTKMLIAGSHGTFRSAVGLFRNVPTA